jgi:hypothetical protein
VGRRGEERRTMTLIPPMGWAWMFLGFGFIVEKRVGKPLDPIF